jgi:hypothetical protein
VSKNTNLVIPSPALTWGALGSGGKAIAAGSVGAGGIPDDVTGGAIVSSATGVNAAGSAAGSEIDALSSASPSASNIKLRLNSAKFNISIISDIVRVIYNKKGGLSLLLNSGKVILTAFRISTVLAS